MEERKWEDLEMDCLACIFGKVGVESLTLAVPFVCKSWYKASMVPLCWVTINFQALKMNYWGNTYIERMEREYRLEKFAIQGRLKFVLGLLKLVLSRSGGSVTQLILHDFARAQDLAPLLQEFGALKVLSVPNIFWPLYEKDTLKLISRWRDLEWLYIEDLLCPFKEILTEISHHCKNFVGLRVSGHIENRHTSTIVTLLPRIRYLNLSRAFMTEATLMGILKGCKQLDQLHVQDCRGFTINDEILNMSSEIRIFNYKGSQLNDADSTDDQYSSSFYDTFRYAPEET